MGSLRSPPPTSYVMVIRRHATVASISSGFRKRTLPDRPTGRIGEGVAFAGADEIRNYRDKQAPCQGDTGSRGPRFAN